MDIEKNKAVVRRFNEAVIERRDLSVMDELFAPDFVNRSVKEGFSGGTDGMIAFLQLFWAAFTDLKVDIHDQVAEADRVSSRKTIRGTHTGTFMGVPATGREIAIPVIDIVRLKAGRYAEHWNLIDLPGVLKQLQEKKA